MDRAVALECEVYGFGILSLGTLSAYRFGISSNDSGSVVSKINFWPL